MGRITVTYVVYFKIYCRVYGRRFWVKIRNTSVRIAGASSETRSRYPLLHPIAIIWRHIT